MKDHSASRGIWEDKGLTIGVLMFASMNSVRACAQSVIPLRIANYIAIVVLVVFVAGCESRRSSRVSRPSGRIVVLGDSLAVSPSRSENFPAILEARLAAAGLSWRVFNAGVRGDTTAGGLRRIDTLIASHRPDILILALGANDGLRRVDVKIYPAICPKSSSVRSARNHWCSCAACSCRRSTCFPMADNFKVLQGRRRRTRAGFRSIPAGRRCDGRKNERRRRNPSKCRRRRRIAETIWPYLWEMLSN